MKANELKGILNRIKKAMKVSKTALFTSRLHISNGTAMVCSLGGVNAEEYVMKDPVFKGLNCVIEFSDLIKVIAKLKRDDVELSVDGKQLLITSARGVFKIDASYDDDSFKLPNKYTELFEIEDNTAALIQKAIKFKANDELRPVMNHVFLDERGHVVASDAHMMIFEKCQELPVDVLVSTEMIDRACVVSISDDKKWLKFENDDEIIYQATSPDTYVDWESVIPKKFPIKTTIGKREFADKLDLCLLSANPASHLGVLDLNKAGGTISAEDIDFNKEFSSEFPAATDDILIGIKITFMLNIIKHIDDEIITLKMTDHTRAIIINDRMLLMPIMVNV